MNAIRITRLTTATILDALNPRRLESFLLCPGDTLAVCDLEPEADDTHDWFDLPGRQMVAVPADSYEYTQVELGRAGVRFACLN